MTSYTLQKNRKQKKMHNSMQNNKANAHLKIGHFASASDHAGSETATTSGSRSLQCKYI